MPICRYSCQIIMSLFRIFLSPDQMKPLAQPMRLRFGNFSFLLIFFLFGLPIGCSILGALYHKMGWDWFHKYYYPILGYYVLVSICQSHYFKPPARPNWFGLTCYAISVSAGIGLYYLHDFVLSRVLSDPHHVTAAHFTYIVLGFLMMGFDDTFYLGAIGHYICKNRDYLKAAFFYLLTWVVWMLFFLTPVAANAAELGGKHFDGVALEWFLASTQWTIMGELICAVHIAEFINSIKWKSNYRRGNATFFGSIIFGFSVAAILYTLNSHIWPHETRKGIWHHVLYQGTAPLHPIILIGLYTNRLEGRYATAGETCFKRTILVLFCTVLHYFFYHCIIAPTQLMGNLPWMHHQDLIWNFTVSILCLQHSWFCGRILFLVPVNDAGKGNTITRSPAIQMTTDVYSSMSPIQSTDDYAAYRAMPGSDASDSHDEI